MAKRRSDAADYLVYLIVRVVICLVQMLSWRAAWALARGLGWLAHRVNRRHREVAADNLRHAYPEWDTPAIDRMVYATYQHWAKTLIEMIRLPRTMRKSNLTQFYRYANPGDFDRAMAFIHLNRPRILLTGHFGNFEAMSYVLGLFGVTGPVIARRLDNPYLDRFLKSFRQKTGQEMLDKNLDYDRILATVSSGGSMGLVGDQDAGARGLFVEFFGRPASTFKSIALLSLEYGAAMIVMGAARVGDPMKYVLYLEDIILPEEHASDADPVRAITQRYTSALERMVRRHPEQYFWLHRRWKHQPKVRASRAA